MGDPGIKSKKEVLRDFVDFVFGFKNKKGDVLGHWIAFLDDFSFSPQEFYQTVEQELEARKIPSMEISREVFSEGGLISDRRIYLKFIRERLVLYTCAAPFGTGYFFSCRTVHVPALVRLWHVLAALLLLSVIGAALVRPLGIEFASVSLVTLVFALVGVLRNAAASALSDLDTFLLKIPVVSTFYENWFRADTYYRIDTRMMYLERVPAIIKELAEDITAAKGAKLVKQYEAAPILGELYKPIARKPEEG